MSVTVEHYVGMSFMHLYWKLLNWTDSFITHSLPCTRNSTDDVTNKVQRLSVTATFLFLCYYMFQHMWSLSGRFLWILHSSSKIFGLAWRRQCRHTGSGAHPAFCTLSTRPVFGGVNQPGHNTYHSSAKPNYE